MLAAIAERVGGVGMTLRIAGGRVYDPANGVAGEVRDVCLSDGKVVDDVPAHATRIDARGMVVMPGGVDIHAHIAGPKVNAARRLAPEEHRADVVERTAIMRSGTGGTVPSTFVTGYRYALLGYTTVVEAATPPLAARHVLAELRDTPMIDALFLLLMGNNVALFDLIRRDPARVRDAIAWWLEATGGYGVKLVNPGGVERWKRDNGNVTSLDDDVAGVTPRQVIEAIAGAVHELGPPASGPRPLQQPRRRRQLAHDARHAAHARTAAGRTSRTCSSTPTAAGPAGRCARRRRSSRSTWAPTPSSAPTSGRSCSGPPRR